jgi:hypothetical protein
MKNLITIFILLSSINFNAQLSQKKLKVIILIDDKVPLTLNHFNISYLDDFKNLNLLNLNFRQGDLVIDIDKYQNLINEKYSDLKFYFEYYPYRTDDQDKYKYSIEINKSILQQEQIIIYVYNLNTKEKRKKYKYPMISNKRKYNFEIGGGAVFYGLVQE